MPLETREDIAISTCHHRAVHDLKMNTQRHARVALSSLSTMMKICTKQRRIFRRVILNGAKQARNNV